MPQLDIPMFTDQIFFFSFIFYLGHIYTNEVILPNVSTLKQYRQLKLNSLKKKSKLFSFFILNLTKKQRLLLKSTITTGNIEISNFEYLLVFLSSFNYKSVKKIFKEQVVLNGLIANNSIKQSINIK